MSLWTHILIFFGERSPCCGAKIYVWSVRKAFCEECDQKV